MIDDKDKKDQLKPFTLFNNETGQSFKIPIISGTDGPKAVSYTHLTLPTILLV